MKKILFIACSIFFCALYAQSQSSVDVADNTFKIPAHKTQEFYYGFAEGDRLIFTFEEVNSKELKEVEITELPSTSKFMDYKCKKIENKIISVNATGIYKFSFYNSAMTERVCKVNIKRIPASENTRQFNSAVSWKTVYDTVYATVQEKYIVKNDTTIYNLTDQTVKVGQRIGTGSNRYVVTLDLPENTIVWSYYIGVNQAGQKAFQDAVGNIARYASPLIAHIPEYGPLAALALGGTSYLTSVQGGEDIEYYFLDQKNMNLFSNGKRFIYIKKAKVINDFSRMTQPLKGKFYIGLLNNNFVQPVDVTIKMTAVTVKPVWGYRSVEKINVNPRKEAYIRK